MIHKFCTSDNVYNIPLVYEKVLGNDFIMSQFIRFIPKMYLTDVHYEITKKIRGVNQHLLRKIASQDFYDYSIKPF